MMFRLFLHVVVLSALLASTSGIILTKHFCGGDFQSLQVNQPHFHCCKKDKTEDQGLIVNRSSCCSNDSVILKCDLTQQKTATVTHIPLEGWVKVPFYQIEVKVRRYYTPGTLYYHPPPYIKDIPVLFQSFIC